MSSKDYVVSKPKPTCPICELPLKSAPSDLGGGPHFNCPSCGSFGVSDFLIVDGHIQLKDPERSKLKHLLFERRLKKGAPFFFASSSGGSARGKEMITFDAFLATYPKRPLEYFDRALENLGRLVEHPVESKAITSDIHAALFSEGDAVDNMLSQLEELRFVELTGPDTHDGDQCYRILAQGWERIQAMERPGGESAQAFVAMWFDPSQTEYFEKGFKPAIEADKRIKALRIDRKDHNNKIDDEIVAEIRRSRFLVADFTDHRGGVYFEAGFALGLGLPVIWCCHEEHIKHAHFDTRQYNHITYKDPEDLRVKLLNRIRATIT